MAEGEALAKKHAASGRRKTASEARERATADAALIGKVTQHWFRHLLATRMLREDPRKTAGA